MENGTARLLERAVRRGDVPGVAACTTDRSGVTFEGGFGRRVLGQAAEMTPDTVVWLASMTKAITGLAAMQMVERGELALDEPAKSVVPDLAEVSVLEGFDSAGKPRFRRPSRDMTLRHLLTHTAGFGYEIFSERILKIQGLMGLPSTNSCQNAALATPLLFDPGERWEYGINIDWAGKMVEAVSGKRLGEYLREHVFGPLGMTDTGFFITPLMRERLAKVHHRSADGSLSPDLELELPQEPEFDAGGHGLYGTVIDYLKFVRMMLDEGRSDRGERVVAPETVALMSANAMGATRVTPLRSAQPQSSHDVDMLPGVDKQWGLSFMINNEQAATGRSAGSLAWAGLANSYFWIDPKRGIGGVYATQVLPFADPKALALYEAFEASAYQS